MTHRFIFSSWIAKLFLLFSLTICHEATFGQTDKLEFFENRIRPVLIEHCYSCHNSAEPAEAGLELDWKSGIRGETSEGQVVIPFRPDESVLIKVIRHEVSGLEMPDGGPKLSDDIVSDFERWIADGAVDPRLQPPTADELAEATSWDVLFERRKAWWSFQPVSAVPLPPETDWSSHPIDRFVAEKQTEHGLNPSVRATRQTLIRRLSFALIGLPPTPDEVDRFVNDPDPLAYENLVDQFLASPRFGERWARHWMDLVRYADSHGSEGDPAIPNAFQYRDYLIRAFNADVPYDQFVREHIAGDLLVSPRINNELKINESAIGTAHYRLVFHGFAPTDALDEKVRFTDDQINVLSKTFQALTLSCARCHDHKFDAISQADYYAMFGVLGSCRPAMQDINLPSRQDLHKSELQNIKSEIQSMVGRTWQSQSQQIMDRIQNVAAADEKQIDRIPVSPIEMLKVVKLKMAGGRDFETVWNEIADGREDQDGAQVDDAWRWNLADPADFQMWFPSGNGLGTNPMAAGEFSIHVEGESMLSSIYPAGVVTNAISNRHRGVIGSPRIHLDGDYVVWLKILGGGQSSVRYVVQNYPRDGTVYPIHNINNPNWHFHRMDLTYWNGDDVHFELATAKDAPLRVGGQDRSWFGIREVIVRKKGEAAPADRIEDSFPNFFATVSERPPKSLEKLNAVVLLTLESAINRWMSGQATDEDALLLNESLRNGLLANKFVELPQVAKLVQRYRELESGIPLPTRVPGMAEADAFDQPLYNRGNHKLPLDPVRRRFLEAIDPTPFESPDSGRLKLANALVHPENPLTTRVITNRLWHYLFGKGIVETPDNFGQLGVPPTHPELLDYLSIRFVDRGWSIKDMIRFIVTSETWKQDSRPSEEASETDPQNKWFSHSNVRRLDAEAIRDSIVYVSGALDETMYGPGFAANSLSRRRSIYVQSRRNSMDAFLEVFDSPVPFATTGRRNETNVPAQSLTLLNDPFVYELAEMLGQKIASDPQWSTDEQRQAELFLAVFGRQGTDEELAAIENFAKNTSKDIENRARNRASLSEQMENLQVHIDNLIEPVREKLLDEKSTTGFQPIENEPMGRWNFVDGLEDTQGNLDGEAQGDVTVSEQGLVLAGNGFVATSPIKNPIEEKTLEVWAKLSTLDQRGGGLITIQSIDGHIFDSIVFGEQTPRHWMAGSNSFQRTQPFEGEAEFEASDYPVHVAITYSRNGTIRGYRNGKPYGKPYRKSDLVRFDAENAQIVFGIRHGTTVSSGRMFHGTILEARFYDRVLSDEEIAASATGQKFVGRKELLAALTLAERKTLDLLENDYEHLEKRLEELQGEVPESEVWTRLAHVLFNLKEFIYVR